jgi:hypothetical protein
MECDEAMPSYDAMSINWERWLAALPVFLSRPPRPNMIERMNGQWMMAKPCPPTKNNENQTGDTYGWFALLSLIPSVKGMM